MKTKMRNLFYLMVGIVFLFGYPASYYISSEVIDITIKDKERITTGSGENIEDKYMIFSNDEVFENTDSWLFIKFNSSDVQGKLEVGKTYNVKVTGWRIPFLSQYRNIISIQ